MAQKKRLTMADVDGTNPGIAILVMAELVPEDGKVMQQVITEGPNHPDPQRSAEAIWESVKDDWPTYGHSYILNDRARYLMANNRTKGLLGEGYPIEDFLADENQLRGYGRRG